MPLQERGRVESMRSAADPDARFINQQAGYALQREAQGLLHTWHEKLPKADIACRASADAVPLGGRNNLCADGTSCASIWHEHVGCAVVVCYNGSRQHFELALPVTVCCAGSAKLHAHTVLDVYAEMDPNGPAKERDTYQLGTFFEKSAK